MNTADKKVSLEIPLNTQMKIFAFLFKENYSMSELFSGTRDCWLLRGITKFFHWYTDK